MIVLYTLNPVYLYVLYTLNPLYLYVLQLVRHSSLPEDAKELIAAM